MVMYRVPLRIVDATGIGDARARGLHLFHDGVLPHGTDPSGDHYSYRDEYFLLHLKLS